MKRVPAVLSVLFSAATLWAQTPTPKLTGVFPPGCQAGKSVQVTLRGADFEEVTGLHFDHPGITAAAPAAPAPPADPKPDPKADPKAKKPKVGMTLATDADRLVWIVTVAPDVPVGMHELRAVTKTGISNSRAFQISDVKEVLEAEPNDTADKAQAVEVDTLVNGQSDKAADIDWYKVKLAKGKRVVIECAAERIDSKMHPLVRLFAAADPEAAKAPTGETAPPVFGKELAANANYAGRHSLIDFTPPADGEYFLQVRDFTYQGSTVDHYYRLSISTRPQVEYTIPAAVEPGKTAEIAVYGRNLPGGAPAPEASVGGRPLEKVTVKVTAPNRPVGAALDAGVWMKPAGIAVDGFEYRLAGPAGSSNPVVIALARDPVVVEKEPNDSAAAAQAVTLPCDITGLFGAKGDMDFYKFEGKKGDVWRIETVSARLGSPADPVVMIGRYDAAGKDGKPGITYLQEGLDDDATQFGLVGGNNVTKFDTRSEDPRALWTVPADGQYFIQIQDLYGANRGDGRFVYRLNIRKAEPDFRLAIIHPDDAMAGGLTVRQGGNQAYQVLCGRYDGFGGTIKVEVSGLPAGVTCAPTYLGPGSSQAPLIFTAAENAGLWTGPIKVTGISEVDGKPVVREARGAMLLSGGNPNDNQTARTARITRDIVLAVRETASFSLVTDRNEVFIVPGGKADVKVSVIRRNGFADAVALTLFNTAVMPNQNNNQKAAGTIAKDKNDVVVSIDVPKTSSYGSYTYAMLGTATVNPDAKAPKSRKAAKVGEPTNAVTVQVAQPMEIVVGALPATLAAGATAELPVTVKRLPGVTEDITITLAGIPGKSFSADPLVLSKGASEGKLVLKADPKAASQSANALSVVGSVTVGGNPLKVTVAVAGKIDVVAAPAPAKDAPKKK